MQQPIEVPFHTLEEEHWWFRARRDCVMRVVEGLGTSRKGKILDLRCSTGSLMAALLANGFTNVSGIDPDPASIQHCKSRGLTNLHTIDPTAPTLPQNSFELLIASDLLHRLEFPSVALENWRRLLKPDGKLLVFVPAYQVLWSQHDVAHHHFRRYTRSRLLEELRVAEFSIMTSGYWNTVPLPAIAAVRMAKRLRRHAVVPPHGDLRPEKLFINRTLQRILSFENALLRGGFRAPFGLERVMNSEASDGPKMGNTGCFHAGSMYSST
jgi:SAM-dependent methyltransferase